MAKRMTKAESQIVGVLVVIAIIVGGVAKFFETVGYIIPIISAVAIITLVMFYKSNQNKKRLEYLRSKYKDEELVQLIFDGKFWVGQTAGQLLDSVGRPVDIDEKVLKTKKKEVWKYQHQGSNRYKLRITLDNDEVVGWDQK